MRRALIDELGLQRIHHAKPLTIGPTPLVVSANAARSGFEVFVQQRSNPSGADGVHGLSCRVVGIVVVVSGRVRPKPKLQEPHQCEDGSYNHQHREDGNGPAADANAALLLAVLLEPGFTAVELADEPS